MLRSYSPTHSSNISKAEYDTVLRTLTVQFSSGDKYRYADVREDQFNGLGRASSAGKYLRTQIMGKHAETKL